MTTPTSQDIATAERIIHHSHTPIKDIAAALAAERSRLDDEFARARDMYLGKIGQLETERSRWQTECERLREALKPFAGISAWADRCSEEDRTLGLRDFMLYLESSAFGSGYKLDASDIRRAQFALAQPATAEKAE